MLPREKQRNEQCDRDPDQGCGLTGFATGDRNHDSADEADRDADDAKQVRPSHAEHDRQHQGDHRGKREHDAGVARTDMRHDRKHQEIGQRIGDRRRDEEITQSVRVDPDALASEQKRDQKHAARTERDNESPYDRRNARIGGDLAERQRQAEQTAGDDEQADGGIPEQAHGGCLSGPDTHRQRHIGVPNAPDKLEHIPPETC